MNKRGFLEYGNVPIWIYSFLIIWLVITLVCMRHINRNISNDYLTRMANKLCLVRCKSDTCNYIIDKTKDSTYYLDENSDNDEKVNRCVFTVWELSHIFFHIPIGFFFNIQTSLFVGISWELIEHYHPDLNCGNIMDIVWNLIGYSIGWFLRYLYTKNNV